jgi:hypothetical protein
MDAYSNVLSFRSRSDKSYTSALLPSHSVPYKCVMYVFDNLDAKNTMNVNVTVHEGAVTSKLDMVTKLFAFTDLTTQAFTSSYLNNIIPEDYLVNVLSVVSTSIDTPDCSGASAAFCSNLNRRPCYNVSHVCGECLDGYGGAQGSGTFFTHYLILKNVLNSY